MLINGSDQGGESKTGEIIFGTPDTLQSLDISLRKPSIDWTIDWMVVRHDGVVPGPSRIITKIFQAKRMADFVNQRAFLCIGKCIQRINISPGKIEMIKIRVCRAAAEPIARHIKQSIGLPIAIT